MPNPTVDILATRGARMRWFKILDRRQLGRIDVNDLLHFAPKLALDPDHASSLFDRLDSDNDGFLDEHDWERVTNTLTYESLVRAEAHPIYCGYFKMQQLGSLSHDRLAEIATSKGLDAAILNRPDEMLPLSPTHSSNKPAPAEHMPAKTPSSIHLVPLPPRYKQGPDPMDLPCVPFAPTLNRPRARRAMIPSGNAKTGPSATALASAAKSAPTLGGDVMQAGKWVTWAMAAIHEDRVGPLIQALASPLADLRCRVRGGGYGLPYSLGPVYSFFVESHFRRENKAALARLDAVIAAEGKYRTPNDILKMREQATLHQRHAGGDTANQSTCLLEDALPGDTLFHLAARAFAPEVGYNLLRAGVDATPPLVELVNSQGLSAMHYWEEALETFDRTPLIDDSTSSSARTRFTTGREMPSSLSSKFATPSASERGGKLNSNRPSARGGSGEAAGGGGVAESQSVVDKRWRDRKREGKLKLRWVRFMAEELVRQLDASLEAIAKIREERLKLVTSFGESLTPWEAQRLEKAGDVATLLEQAHHLLDRAHQSEPNTVRGPTTDESRALELKEEASNAAQFSTKLGAIMKARYDSDGK